MPDEQNYISYLMSYEEAMQKLGSPDRNVLEYVWKFYVRTMKWEEEERRKREERRLANRMSQRQASANVHYNPSILTLSITASGPKEAPYPSIERRLQVSIDVVKRRNLDIIDLPHHPLVRCTKRLESKDIAMYFEHCIAFCFLIPCSPIYSHTGHPPLF